MDDVQLSRVSDIAAGRLEFVAERYPDIAATLDAEAILSDPEIDGVVIATPPKTHHKLALAALQAGKHVMVEKPLSTSVAEGEELVEVATRLGRVLAVGHVFLYASAVARIRSLFDERTVGELYYISAVRTNVGPPNGQVDVLWDLAPHDISIILNLVKEPPKEIFAQAGSFTSSKLVETAFLVLRFADGRLAHIHVGWLTSNKVRLLRMVCSRGEVVYDDMQQIHKVQVHNPAIDNRVQASSAGTSLSYSSGGIWSPSLLSFEPLRAECQDFVNSIRTRTPPLSDGQAGLEVVRVLEAASQCLQNGGRSKLQRFCALAPGGGML
jgi:predicted dehydrogenase